MNAARAVILACTTLLAAACGHPATEIGDPALKVCDAERTLTCVDWGLDADDDFACVAYACVDPDEDGALPASAAPDAGRRLGGPIRRPTADFTRAAAPDDQDDQGDQGDQGDEDDQDDPGADPDESPADDEADPQGDDAWPETAEAWPDAEPHPDGDRPDPEGDEG